MARGGGKILLVGIDEEVLSWQPLTAVKVMIKP